MPAWIKTVHYNRPHISKPFNIVFTNEDLVKQIVNYTKEDRVILKRREELDLEAEHLIHVCLKFYEMDDMHYSYIYNDLVDSVVIDNLRKYKDKTKLTDFCSNKINSKYKKGSNCYGYIFEAKHITKWIREYYKDVDEDVLENINYFRGEDFIDNDNSMFCIKCKKYADYYLCQDSTYIGVFNCEFAVCDYCISGELRGKNGLITKCVKTQRNKYIRKFK